MNNKFYIGLGLLLFLLIFGLLTGFFVERQQNAVQELLSSALKSAEGTSLQEGKALALRAQNRWQQSRTRLTCLCHHAAIEEIDRSFSQLAVCGEKGEFLLRCAELCSLLETLASSHRFTWWNLL